MSSEKNKRQTLRRRLRFGGLAAALVLAAVLAGLGEQTAASSTTAGEVKIALLTVVSGPASVWYPSIKQATQLAVDEINASGGVLGKRVKLITADSKTTPAVAASQARRLAHEGIVFVVQQDIAADRDAAIPAFAQANIPHTFSWSYEGGPLGGGTAQMCHKNIWATGQVPNDWIPAPMAYLTKNQGIKKWFLIGSDYKWPRTMNALAAKVIKANGGSIAGEQYVPLGTSEFTALVTRVKGAGPDVGIVNNLVGGDLLGFFKQWHEAGGKNERMISFDLDEDTAGALGKAAAGTLGSYDYYYTSKNPGNVGFLKRLRAKFGAKIPRQHSLSEQGYEAIWLWALAARKAGSFKLDDVNKAYLQVSLLGPRGRVRYLPNHHMALPNVLARLNDTGLYTTVIKNFGVIKPANQCSPSAYK